MFSKICNAISQNKNVLMLTTTCIYILAIFSVLSENIFIFAFGLCLLFIILEIKKLISSKYLIVLALIFFLGVANTSLRIKQTDELLNLAPRNAEVWGTIISIPQGGFENKTKFFFNTEKIKFDSVEKTFKSEKILVSVNMNDATIPKSSDLKLYNSLILQGRLSTPFKAGNPSQFDYGNYLRNHNAYAVFYADNFVSIDNIHNPKEKFIQKINEYRENILGIHSKYIKSPNLEILGGIVFGDDAVSPPQNIKKSFISSGLLHILAASGMNVAFIYAFFYFLMSILRVKFKIKVCLGMVMVVIYTLMTGLGASVIRAAAMLLFVLTGKLIDRDAYSISLLSFVALLMLLYNPLWISDVSFQLSFVVTFGILMMASAIDRFKSKVINFLITTVTIPIIAQLWVIPIQIFYFNNISIYSVFANIMSVPIVMLLSFGGFISSLISLVTPVADIICKIFDFILNPLISLLVKISDFWGNLPHSSLQTAHPAIFQIFLYYGILICLSLILNDEFRKKHLNNILKTIITLTLLLLISIIPIKNTNLEITAFDVGNADCFLIKTPDNKYIMIDTGKFGFNGGKSQAEIIVIKYLKDNGIKNLDSIIVTHFDNDHCGGVVDILKNIKVNKVYINNNNHESNAFRIIHETVLQTNTKEIPVNNKQIVYDNDGLSIVNLNNYKGKSDNDNSIITLVKYNNFSMLFTGDAGIKGINAVKEEIPQNITVLKAPHHGAVGGIDKELAHYLNPQYTIISTGYNQFGHPSLYILALLKNSVILRTDVNNSIRIIANKKITQLFCFDIKSRKYKKFENYNRTNL